MDIIDLSSLHPQRIAAWFAHNADAQWLRLGLAWLLIFALWLLVIGPLIASLGWKKPYKDGVAWAMFGCIVAVMAWWTARRVKQLQLDQRIKELEDRALED